MRESPDTASYVAIVPTHAAAMLRVAAALIGSAEAEDAVQEAAVRAWQAWPTLRDVGAARAWLLRITANVCYSWRRGAAAQRFAHALPLPDDDMPFLALLDTDLGTSDHTGALDLREAINALPSGLRSVVVLRYYAGMDATETSEVLGIPAGTVRSRLHRALLQLRARLSPPGSPAAAAHQTEDR